MYVPPAFEVKDPSTLWDFIRARSVGLLISQSEDGLLANFIPFQVVEKMGALQLHAHLAKANPQWRNLAGQNVLAVFQGEDAYITPRWYEAKREHGKVVPTWNYAMVQVRGDVRVIDDKAWLLDQVSSLTDHHEQAVGQGNTWKTSDAPSDFIQSQLKGIVGIEIDVTELTGKVKASQNRTAADRAGVVAGLTSLDTARSLAMAELVSRKQD